MLSCLVLPIAVPAFIESSLPNTLLKAPFFASGPFLQFGPTVRVGRSTSIWVATAVNTCPVPIDTA
jgi:hypothetical protein